MVAAGEVDKTLLSGNTIIEEGTFPNEHFNMAPFATKNPIDTSNIYCLSFGYFLSIPFIISSFCNQFLL
jgi:hypothetical protein